MHIEKINNFLLEILSEMGIYIDMKIDEENDIDLTEYISNSIDFITFFIEIEDTLNIELPDTLLGLDNIKSLHAFANKIMIYLQEQEKTDFFMSEN